MCGCPRIRGAGEIKRGLNKDGRKARKARVAGRKRQEERKMIKRRDGNRQTNLPLYFATRDTALHAYGRRLEDRRDKAYVYMLV